MMVGNPSVVWRRHLPYEGEAKLLRLPLGGSCLRQQTEGFIIADYTTHSSTMQKKEEDYASTLNGQKFVRMKCPCPPLQPGQEAGGSQPV